MVVACPVSYWAYQYTYKARSVAGEHVWDSWAYRHTKVGGVISILWGNESWIAIGNTPQKMGIRVLIFGTVLYTLSGAVLGIPTSRAR